MHRGASTPFPFLKQQNDGINLVVQKNKGYL
jgi:hypothetical protein